MHRIVSNGLSKTGHEPTEGVIRARAPLRLGFAGGGTDVSPYCDRHGGAILNATIGMYAYAEISPRHDGTVRLVAADLEKTLDANDLDALPTSGSLALHAATYRRIVRDYKRGVPLSLTLTTFCEVAAGSGLGSSSTLVVAMVEAFKEYLGLPLGEYEVAQLAHSIERSDVGLQGGKQDQYAATFGGFNFMEFLSGGRVIVNPLRIKTATVNELESALVLYYTGVSRESAAIIAEQASNVQSDDKPALEAMHSLKEEAHAMKLALLTGNIRGFADVLGRSWQTKKKTARGVSNEFLDGIYDRAMGAGAYAGKVSGAGGGGFMMFLTEPSKRPAVARALQQAGGHVMPCHFTQHGAESWRVL